jgi:hypothetical protein
MAFGQIQIDKKDMDEQNTRSYDSTKDTVDHINNVQEYLLLMATKLLDRGLNHDRSKLDDPELEIFNEFTPKLKQLTFDSDEYKKCREEMAPALNHHYAKNRHHPEHFAEGINDMTLIDILEMLCDWKAATLRQNDGNLRKSLDSASKRFNIDTQLKKILLNSIGLFD